jgi:hypothetical protein
MSGASIAAEVATALSEVARDVGNGEFVVTLKQATNAPANPWGTGGTVTETELPAIIQDYPRSMIDGTVIQMGDRRVMMSALGPRPSTGDTLEVQGQDFRVLMVKDLAPSGVALYYELQARV